MLKIKKTLIALAAILLTACGGTGDNDLSQTALTKLEFKQQQCQLELTAKDKQHLLILYNGSEKANRALVKVEQEDNFTAAAKISTSHAENYRAKLLSFTDKNSATILQAKINSTNSAEELKTFNVLQSLSDLKNYKATVTKLVNLSEKSAFYVDLAGESRWYEESKHKAAILKLQQIFDQQIIPTDKQYFGETSDVDNFAPIFVLISSQINRLSGDLDGQLRGFFFSGDLLSSNSVSNPASNQTEIIYLAAPRQEDRENYFDNILPTTLAHELQHLINYNERVLKRGYQPEEHWLNEALSHLAEELNGQFKANLARQEYFLKKTYQTSLTGKNDSVEQRGGNSLFLSYLLNSDQRPTDKLLKELITNPKTGATKLSDIFSNNFSDLIGNFSLALWFANNQEEAKETIGFIPQVSLSSSADGEQPEIISPYLQKLEKKDYLLPNASISYFYIEKGNENLTLFSDSNNISGYLLPLP